MHIQLQFVKHRNKGCANQEYLLSKAAQQHPGNYNGARQDKELLHNKYRKLKANTSSPTLTLKQ